MTSRAPHFWSAAEVEALGPYVRDLAGGKYASAFAAARAYLAEASHRSRPARSLRAVAKHVINEARRQSLTWGDAGWSAPELRVLKRYARALAQGRYRYQREAVTACAEEMELKCGRRRTLVVVEVLLRALLHNQGVVWGGSRLFEAERRSVTRHARALVRGRFADALRAAEACLRELRKLPYAERPIRPRSLHTIHCNILKQAHRMRRLWARARWRGEEDRVVRRYGAALAQGEYPSALAATAACRRELGRSAARARPPRGVMVRLVLWAHRSGWVRFHSPWNAKEHAVMDRHLREFYEGRYNNLGSAAKGCYQELRSLHHRLSRQSGPKTGPRTLYATQQEMTRRARNLGLPRSHVDWTKEETAVVLRYARAVDRGEFPSWRRAARECLAELGRLYTATGRRSAIHARRLVGRSLSSVHEKVILTAHQHGLRGPEKPRLWSPAEGRVFEQWLRWYDRYRSARRRLRPSPLATASTGLQEELDERGFKRTVSACRTRLKNGWLQMHGLA